jgi:hypothetical protein
LAQLVLVRCSAFGPRRCRATRTPIARAANAIRKGAGCATAPRRSAPPPRLC